MTGPVLVDVIRSGEVESVHTGHLVVLGPTGEIVLERGRPDLPVYWRSSAKPLQATAVLNGGAALTEPQLAIAAASHSGEPLHVETVMSTLADAGLTEDDLGCPPDWPIDPDAAAHARVDGAGKRRIYMNCSGKHASMLSLCHRRGWPTATYLEVDHPLQQLIRQVVESIAHEKVTSTGVDGCGLPLFALSLRSLARSFRELRGGPVADAMRAHPFLVGGTDRLATQVLAGIPGVIAKDGAEGVFAASLPDGSAFAVKVDDGGQRATQVLVGRILQLLGAEGDLPPAETPVLGGGRPVGTVRVRPGVLPVR